MEIDLIHDSLPIIHALDSETRIDIINLLAREDLTVTQLAAQLHYSKAIISKHVQALKKANIVYEIQDGIGDLRQKILTVHSDKITINLPEKIYPYYQRKEYDVPVGNYFSHTEIEPTCGLASKESVIEAVDDPDAFLSAQRLVASLMWFSKGQVEYIVPNPFYFNQRPKMIEVSFEISSEFPGSNNNWPSDISFWLNDIKVGTWTVPGNFSDIRGRLTPSWWRSDFSQYGLLKHLRIQQGDTAVDGNHISDKTISDLSLDSTKNIRFRIGIDPESANQGGLTIFGRDFGNYHQDIHITCYYSSI